MPGHHRKAAEAGTEPVKPAAPARGDLLEQTMAELGAQNDGGSAKSDEVPQRASEFARILHLISKDSSAFRLPIGLYYGIV